MVLPSPRSSTTEEDNSRKKKSQKKRKLNSSSSKNSLLHDVSQFANLTGFETTTTTTTQHHSQSSKDNNRSSIDDCMMEMMEMGQTQQQQQNQLKSVTTTTQRQAVRDGTSSTTKSKSVLPPPCWIERPFMTTNDIRTWHQDFIRWADSGQYTPGLLPNVDEELARNFKVKDLSAMLLKTGKDLRMPIFERWLLDSKYEECTSISNTRGQTTDPVLPSKASPKSAASKRLINELITSSSSSHKNSADVPSSEQAEQTVAELCRSCNVACQELMSQSERYQRQSSLRKGDRIELETTKQRHQRIGAADDDDDDDDDDKSTVTILYTRKKWKKPFCFRINADSLEKLRQRFYHVHNEAMNSSSSSKYVMAHGSTDAAASATPITTPFHQKHKDLAERSFLVLVVAMLLRYSALSGGQLLDDLRGGGMQGAIHSAIFDVLQQHLSSPSSSASFISHAHRCWLEGFASPFNATLERFGSAFPDLDWHFGSVGNFFSFAFASTSNIHGSKNGGSRAQGVEEYCEANPPFSPGLMEGMAGHMMDRLEVAKANGSRLTFVVIVPTVKGWTKSKSKMTKRESDFTEGSSSIVQEAASSSFRAMVESVFCTQHIRLCAREHGYVEGSQHLRPTQYKQSSYNTSVIILQSPEAGAAAEKQCNRHDMEKDIRTAFASRHEVELQKRKRKVSGTSLV
jgi:phosphorylated CTD-interacting factor 1